MKLHPGLGEDIDDFTAIKFPLNCSLIRWCMIILESSLKVFGNRQKSSNIFRNLRNFQKMFADIRVTLGQVFESLRKSHD